MLSMFGGRLEENEDPAVGAVRELHEETGVHLPLSQLNFLGDALFTREDGTQTHCSMFCALIVDLASMSVKEGEEYDDRKNVVEGKRVSVRVDVGGRRSNNKKMQSRRKEEEK